MQQTQPARPVFNRNAVRVAVLVIAAGVIGVLLTTRPSGDPEALYAQAQQYAQEFRYDEALQAAQDALAIVQRGGYAADVTAQYHLLRGQMWLLVYEWDKALADYDAAISLAPDYPQAYYLRGVFYANLSAGGGVDQLRHAVADFERALALDGGGSYAERAQSAIDDLTHQIEALSGG